MATQQDITVKAGEDYALEINIGNAVTATGLHCEMRVGRDLGNIVKTFSDATGEFTFNTLPNGDVIIRLDLEASDQDGFVVYRNYVYDIRAFKTDVPKNTVCEGKFVVSYTEGGLTDFQVNAFGLGSPAGQNGRGVSNAAIDEGRLIISYTDNTSQDAGFVGGTGEGEPGEPGADGVGIANATVNGSGHLIFTLSNSAVIDAGLVLGPQGQMGQDGEQGPQGLKGDKGDTGDTGPTGADGAKGDQGEPGADGEDGISVSNAQVISGSLIITYSNGHISNAGYVQGSGSGSGGGDGQDGVSIINAVVDLSGDLIITYSNAAQINAGHVVGAAGQDGIDGADGAPGADGAKGDKGDTGDQGPAGADGADGQNGIGIDSASLSNGHLVLTYSNAAVANVGLVQGPQGLQGDAGAQGLPGANGAAGQAGANGIGVASATLSNGYLNLTYTNAVTANVGLVQGAQGIQGQAGANGTSGSNGANGVSVVNATVTAQNYLNLGFSNGATANAGLINVPTGSGNGGVSTVTLEGEVVGVSNSAGYVATAVSSIANAETISSKIYLEGHQKISWSNTSELAIDVSLGTTIYLMLSATPTRIFFSNVPVFNGKALAVRVIVTGASGTVLNNWDYRLSGMSSGYLNISNWLNGFPTLPSSGGITIDFNFVETAGGGGYVVWPNMVTKTNSGTVTNVAVTSSDLTVSGSPITSAGTINLALSNTGVTAGTYSLATVTVDAKGRITAASNGSSSGSGTVTSVALSSSDLTVTGGPITTSGTISLSLANSGVSAGSYSLASLTVDAKGRVTAISNGSLPAASAIAPNASYTVQNVTVTSGAATLDLANATDFVVPLSANITSLTFSNPPTSGAMSMFTIEVVASGSAYSIAWPASVKWSGSTAPTLSSGSGKVDIFTFRTRDGGTTWYGSVVGVNF